MNDSWDVSISGDGRFIAFASDASNLVSDDTNLATDVFVVANPLADPTVTRTFIVGDAITDLNLGLVPNPGTISGTLFEDTVTNSVLDSGEPRLKEWIVYLDTNLNNRLDEGELSTATDADGYYQFLNVPSHRAHRIVVQAQPDLS